MRLLRPALAILQQHRRAFVVINGVCLLVFVASLSATLADPTLQEHFKPELDEAYATPGLFKFVGEAYAQKHLVTAIVMTFLVNAAVALTMTTLPSLLVPAVGLIAVLHRCVLWGVMFAPVGDHPRTLIPHALTLLLEGAAYILAGFAAYVHARLFLRPADYGLTSHRAGYRAGVRAVFQLYALVLLLLAVAAVYEVFEAIYLMPHFL